MNISWKVDMGQCNGRRDQKTATFCQCRLFTAPKLFEGVFKFSVIFFLHIFRACNESCCPCYSLQNKHFESLSAYWLPLCCQTFSRWPTYPKKRLWENKGGKPSLGGWRQKIQAGSLEWTNQNPGRPAWSHRKVLNLITEFICLSHYPSINISTIR